MRKRGSEKSWGSWSFSLAVIKREKKGSHPRRFQEKAAVAGFSEAPPFGFRVRERGSNRFRVYRIP